MGTTGLRAQHVFHPAVFLRNRSPWCYDGAPAAPGSYMRPTGDQPAAAARQFTSDGCLSALPREPRAGW
ncbi:hypothetical protein [Streptomyces kaempferi]|uniref:hypothetical protein n=1 Tax=Streptomyces kaempferi TaxID=333725 RepID=UPI0036D20F28